MTSTMLTSILYLAGFRASSMIGIRLGLLFAMFTNSLPLLSEISTAKTHPSYQPEKQV